MTQSADQRDRFGERLAQVAPDLLTYFRRRVRPVEDAADLLSECLVVGWRRHQEAPASSEDLRRWMFGIARNVLRNWTRGTKRRSELVERLRLELAGTSSESAVPELMAAIERLPTDQAELLQLVHWEGFAVTEAAVILGISESTARGRYQRARQRLSADPDVVSLAREMRFSER